MPYLIIEHPLGKKAGILSGRVLIGRGSDNSIILDDPAVSRIHAWIGVQHGAYYIADAGSKNSTFVNGTRLTARHVLASGDQIRIGPATIHFASGNILPDDLDPIDLTPQTADKLSSANGSFIECDCGAPMWLPHGFAGTPRCRYCGQAVHPSAETLQTSEPPADSAPQDEPAYAMRIHSESICGICHSPITAQDAVTACGSCSLPFHAECWEENHGCSAYGCDQVGILDRRNAG